MEVQHRYNTVKTPLKVLNNYAGIGGNRKKWNDCQVTAVENNEKIAQIYKDLFPQDNVIVADAHQYLLEHYSEFDFIWSSPPCPTHSRANYWANAADNRTIEYPDMRLYQEIILLQHYFKKKFVVENVIPYYEPLIPGKQFDRHIFWTNFPINNIEIPQKQIAFNMSKISDWENYYGYDLSQYKIDNKLKILRNCVHPLTGLHILNCARNIITKQNILQTELF